MLYGKPDCELCEEMKAVVDEVRRTTPCTLEIVDVSADPDLSAVYGLDIPVLTIDGRKAFKHRIDGGGPAAPTGVREGACR